MRGYTHVTPLTYGVKAPDFSKKCEKGALCANNVLMTQKTRGRIHLIYGIILSVMILSVGVCFALSVLSIYQSGSSSPYTAESISAHFSRFAPLVYVTLATIVGGVILAWTLPRRDLVVGGPDDDPLDVIVERYRRGLYHPVKDPAAILKRLLARVDEEALTPACRVSIAKERLGRRVVGIAAAVLSVAAMLPAVIWCVNANHFSVADLSADIRTAALFVIPCAAVTLGLLVGATLFRQASVMRETALVKAALSERKGMTAPVKKDGSDSEKRFSDPRLVWSVRAVILVVGVLFVVLGVLNGGMSDVLGKAIRICTECIGLG